ncbi:hypothetical protein HanIR_Chr02g0067801 [Helianthus annuus]|nr:hypothetical protein HanIR_Chr02g0067801 [Helianthus annuus]
MLIYVCSSALPVLSISSLLFCSTQVIAEDVLPSNLSTLRVFFIMLIYSYIFHYNIVSNYDLPIMMFLLN